MTKVEVIDVEKDCPVCGETGKAQANDDGEFIDAWACFNEDCPKEFFVSDTVQFYDSVNSLDNWTWEKLDV